MSALSRIGGNQKITEGQDRWDPDSDEDAVEPILDLGAIGEEQPHAQDKTCARREKSGDAQDCRGLHTRTLPHFETGHGKPHVKVFFISGDELAVKRA